MLGFRTKSALLVYSIGSLTRTGELVKCARLDQVIMEFTVDYIINLNEQNPVDFHGTQRPEGVQCQHGRSFHVQTRIMFFAMPRDRKVEKHWLYLAVHGHKRDPSLKARPEQRDVQHLTTCHVANVGLRFSQFKTKTDDKMNTDYTTSQGWSSGLPPSPMPYGSALNFHHDNWYRSATRGLSKFSTMF